MVARRGTMLVLAGDVGETQKSYFGLLSAAIISS
jgi:hypothetical protein